MYDRTLAGGNTYICGCTVYTGEWPYNVAYWGDGPDCEALGGEAAFGDLSLSASS